MTQVAGTSAAVQKLLAGLSASERAAVLANAASPGQ